LRCAVFELLSGETSARSAADFLKQCVEWGRIVSDTSVEHLQDMLKFVSANDDHPFSLGSHRWQDSQIVPNDRVA
jgi:hypothetical protein